MMDTYKIIQALQDDGQLLRVWDETSVSPRTSSGFTATNFNRTMTNKRWSQKYQDREDTTIEDGDSRDEVVRHVTGKWGWSTYAYDSDYISTTGRFDWAIWEIVRRLKEVRRDEVYLAVIDRYNFYSPNYRGCKTFWVDAVDKIKEGKVYNGSQEEEALRFARASNEILYFGRIFDKDVLANTTWTEKEPGLLLPQHFFVPKKHRSAASRYAWIDRLVWDSADNFAVAQRKLATRKDQIETSRL